MEEEVRAPPELPADLLRHIFSLMLESATAEDAAGLVRLSSTCVLYRKLLLAPQLWRTALAQRWPAASGAMTYDVRRLFCKMLQSESVVPFLRCLPCARSSEVAAGSKIAFTVDESEPPGTDLASLQVFCTVRQGTLAQLLSKRSRGARTLFAQTLEGAESMPVAHRLDSSGEDWRPVGLEWHGLGLAWPEEHAAATTPHPAKRGAPARGARFRSLVGRAYAEGYNEQLLAVSVCFFRPSDGKFLQLPEARIYLAHGRMNEPQDAVYFEPVDLAAFPTADPVRPSRMFWIPRDMWHASSRMFWIPPPRTRGMHLPVTRGMRPMTRGARLSTLRPP